MTSTIDRPATDPAVAAALAKARREAWILAHERRYAVMTWRFGDEGLPYSEAKKWTAYSPECIAPRHPEDARPAADRHAWLCPDCTEQIRADFFTLAGCWPFLEDLLIRGPGKPGERSGTNENAAAPMDLTVADLRLRISGWTTEIVGHLLEDKPGTTATWSTTPEALRWIGRWHAYYIATHPQDSFPLSVIDELRDLRREVRTLTFPEGTLRRPITSTCAALDEDGTCGGQLYALVRDRADPRGSAVICRNDPAHLIPEADWLGILKSKTKGRP